MAATTTLGSIIDLTAPRAVVPPHRGLYAIQVSSTLVKVGRSSNLCNRVRSLVRAFRIQGFGTPAAVWVSPAHLNSPHTEALLKKLIAAHLKEGEFYEMQLTEVAAEAQGLPFECSAVPLLATTNGTRPILINSRLHRLLKSRAADESRFLSEIVEAKLWELFPAEHAAYLRGRQPAVA